MKSAGVGLSQHGIAVEYEDQQGDLVVTVEPGGGGLSQNVTAVESEEY